MSVIDQQAVVDTFRRAEAAAIRTGPITIQHVCDCQYCDVKDEDAHYAPAGDALMLVWSDLHTLALARRFDGLELIPGVVDLITFAEKAQGTAMDKTSEEVTASMQAALEGIASAMGTTLSPTLR